MLNIRRAFMWHLLATFSSSGKDTCQSLQLSQSPIESCHSAQEPGISVQPLSHIVLGILSLYLPPLGFLLVKRLLLQL
jgi:hypothetical protein